MSNKNPAFANIHDYSRAVERMSRPDRFRVLEHGDVQRAG